MCAIGHYAVVGPKVEQLNRTEHLQTTLSNSTVLESSLRPHVVAATVSFRPRAMPHNNHHWDRHMMSNANREMVRAVATTSCHRNCDETDRNLGWGACRGPR